MIQLSPDESRVLGVLIEKALTTPDQYPLTLNAVINGANQKSNRDPVISLDDTRSFDALESLRAKGLAVRVDSVGSRTNKYRHNAAEVLRLRTGELVVLAELLLRGPQTLGELRGRASRMHALESLDVVKGLLRGLSEREEPLVEELLPSPGSRAERYAQLLCPELNAVDATSEVESGELDTEAEDSSLLSTRMTRLEEELVLLRNGLRKLAESVGEPDPLRADPIAKAE